MSLKAPALVVKVDPDKVAAIAAQMGYSKSKTQKEIEDILNNVLDWTLKDMKTWIYTFVPKRTGQLRDNLWRNLNSSRVYRSILKMTAMTYIDYAAKVNQMTTSQVRHHSWREHSGAHAYAYYYGHGGRWKSRARGRLTGHSPNRIFLNDPKAIGNFWDKMLKYMKERVDLNLAKAMKKHLGKEQLLWKASWERVAGGYRT